MHKPEPKFKVGDAVVVKTRGEDFNLSFTVGERYLNRVANEWRYTGDSVAFYYGERALVFSIMHNSRVGLAILGLDKPEAT